MGLGSGISQVVAIALHRFVDDRSLTFKVEV